MSLFNSTLLCLVSKIEYTNHEILQMYVWLSFISLHKILYYFNVNHALLIICAFTLSYIFFSFVPNNIYFNMFQDVHFGCEQVWLGWYYDYWGGYS
jgi:hypothetical protein